MAMITCVATSFAQKKLVLYYSENGTTKTVAEELQKQLGAVFAAFATHSIKPWFTPPYTMLWPLSAAHLPSSSVIEKNSGSI